MKFDWLKTILGDSYTEDMDTKIAEEMPKHFVLKADFDAKNGALKPLRAPRMSGGDPRYAKC
jgi:hypothetical protein